MAIKFDQMALGDILVFPKTSKYCVNKMQTIGTVKQLTDKCIVFVTVENPEKEITYRREALVLDHIVRGHPKSFVFE